MTTFESGGLTGAGSTTLPLFALVGGTGVRPRILEMAVFNTTSTAVALRMVRLSTAGTPGSTFSSDKLDPGDVETQVALLKGTYTSTGPTIASMGTPIVLGAAIGSAFVRTWEDNEFRIPAIANAGFGLVVDNGTGQALQVYMKWRE